MKRAHQDTVCGLKLVCFRGDNGVIIQVWTSTDGKVDFKILANYFLLKLETITLNGTVFPLDSTGTGKSDASWMQIKNALRVEGTEEHPVRVGGNPENAGESSELVQVVKEFSQVNLQLQQLQKQVGDVKEQVGYVKEQLKVEDVEMLVEYIKELVLDSKELLEDVKEQMGNIKELHK